MASGDMALGDTHGILAWHALHLRHLAAFCVAGGRFLCGRRGIYGTGPRSFVTHDVQRAICETGMALAALRWIGWTALVAVTSRRFTNGKELLHGWRRGLLGGFGCWCFRCSRNFCVAGVLRLLATPWRF